MDILKEIVLFPHIRLTSAENAVLPALCERADMLVPDDRIGGLPSLVKPYTLGGAASEKVLQTYREFKKFADEVLAQKAAPIGYIPAEPQSVPLYDPETPSHILSDFRTGVPFDVVVPQLNREVLTAAVTLLLSEDVLELQNEAHRVLASIDGKSKAMWRNLKGTSDPFQLDDDTLPPQAFDDGLMKKRLTAWSILARMLLLTDVNVWLTFEKPVIDLCLATFTPEKPLKEITLEKARVVFYQLPLAPKSFAVWLTDTDAAYAHDSNEFISIGFVELY